MEWTIQQLREATPFGLQPKYLYRDNDAIFRYGVPDFLKSSGIQEVRIAYRCPWQNPYCERVIGSIRREYTNHIIALGEKHLVRTLREYARWYNALRPHLSLDRNTPEPRMIQSLALGSIHSEPVLGGLHHRYFRAA